MYDTVPSDRIHAYRGPGISAVQDYTCGGKKLHKLSETTIKRRPFIAPDLVVCEF